jgi:hypothetical protein
VTAGHCTTGTSGGRVWLDSDIEGMNAVTGNPFSGGTGHEADHAWTHPLYIDAAFFLFDVGVLTFDEPVYAGPYASLPGLDAMDSVGKGRNNTDALVTAVGYGLQNANKNHTVANKTRMQADLMVVDVNGVAGIGSINPGQSAALSGDAKHGGTCFGERRRLAARAFSLGRKRLKALATLGYYYPEFSRFLSEHLRATIDVDRGARDRTRSF